MSEQEQIFLDATRAMLAALSIPPTHDTPLKSKVMAAIDNKTKPQGSLGQLEHLALQIALVQGRERPRELAPQLLLFAADHGIAGEGVSLYPQAVTRQMVQNFVEGGAAANVFARSVGVPLTVVDAGIKEPLPESARVREQRLGAGTASFLHGPAMSHGQCHGALAAGIDLARSCKASGINTLLLGEMGIGNTSSASMLISMLLSYPLEEVVGPGTGLGQQGLAHKRQVLTQARRGYAGEVTALGVLRHFGGFEIAMMVGAYLGAAHERMLLVVDGFIASAAMLVASRMHPEVLDYAVFAHVSAEPFHQTLLDRLGVRPLLRLGMRLGEGTGALLAVPLLRASLAMLREMASFAEAAVDGPSSLPR